MLTEREKMIALISRVRAMMEVQIYHTNDDTKTIIAAGRQILHEMSTELGIIFEMNIYEDIIKFEDELDVISSILNKEDGIHNN